MICVSIGNIDFERLKSVLKEIKMAEIRLDQMSFSIEQVQEIFSVPASLIATFRPGNRGLDERREYLRTAISAGADYVDIEMESPTAFREELGRLARDKGCRVIISYHNHTETPPGPELAGIVQECFNFGADMVKVACQVRLESECARLISLYDTFGARKGRLIALGMGDKGRLTRIAAPLLGAPFTYASLLPGQETAAGQLDGEKLARIMDMLITTAP